MIFVSKLVIVRPESGADRGLGAGGARALERLENPLQIALVNADAGVRHGKLGDLMAIVDLERHVAGIGELDGIGKEIDQDLAQPVLVGLHHRRQPHRPDIAKLDPLSDRLQAEHVDEFVEEVRDMHLVAAEMQAAGLDFRDIEQSVDQAGQMLGAAAHHLEALIRGRGIAGSRSRSWA